MNLIQILARYLYVAASKSDTAKRMAEKEPEFIQTPGFQKFKKKVGVIFIIVIAIAFFLSYLT